HGIVAFYPDGVKTIPVDVIFPVLHGKNGEDGTIQGLFAMSGIPFVGCHTFASSVCMDKAATHTILSANRIEQTPYLWFYADRYEDSEGRVIIRKKVNARLNFPVFVKPANAGSSVGISKVNSMDELDEAVAKAAKEDVKIVIEEGVIGQEVECAVLGNRDAKASIVGEIGTTAAFYDYDDKYKNGTSQLYIPARLSDEISEEIRRTAVRAYRLLGCAGLSRVDFFVTPEGRIILTEINTLPGFTAISMYPKLWEATGLAYGDLLDQLVELAEQA
ncbi:MAG: D-alanine--D-alanine ligase, partial [Clostridia bacterium]|nr:D-alanine--D-alanine ligase [Clostridia bacterium]